MAQRTRARWRPSDYLVVGWAVSFAGGVFGGCAYLLGSLTIGIVVASVFSAFGSTFWTIGLIGKGVEAGVRAASSS